MNNKLREQYCLEKGGINPSNIIEWYYIEWLESKLTETKQSDNSELISYSDIWTKWCEMDIKQFDEWLHDKCVNEFNNSHPTWEPHKPKQR